MGILLGGNRSLACEYQLGHVGQLCSSELPTLTDTLSTCSINYREECKIADFSVSPFSSVSFCIMHLETFNEWIQLRFLCSFEINPLKL